VKKILILSANPTNTSKLRLDEEVREIQAGLERAKSRDKFEIITKFAVRSDDLRRALLDYEPEIVHFSGHGSGEDGLVLENATGQMQLVSTESLARLFGLFEKTECVLLNACYSEAQAEAIFRHVDCVIGMNQIIGDRAAIEFAVGFYDALGANRSYEDAYEFGCSAIALEGIPEFATPVLKSRIIANNSNSKGNAVENDKPAVENGNIPTLIYPLENPEGQVPLESAFYIERLPIETDCYQEILKPGSLIRAKAPRQMGKTSLMSRILHHATQKGFQVASLNFQEADAEFLTSIDAFLRWFCGNISYELNLPDKLDDFWQGVLGSKSKSTKYFERYLLPEIQCGIVLALDEVDEVFKHPEIAADFFGLLRSWHERAKNEPIWQKLRLVIVHSKEVYIPLNINQSPFNVGLPIELPELTQLQVEELVQRHGINWTNKQVERLMRLVGGHPYLVRVALYQIARDRMTLEKLIQIAATEESPYSDHLRRHLLNLQEDEKLQIAVRRILTSDLGVDVTKVGTRETFKLRSMGLVKFQGNAVMLLCNLYRQYFHQRLGIN
jgi:AAA-like domain/CHAT domain